jgi:hypothetical protein
MGSYLDLHYWLCHLTQELWNLCEEFWSLRDGALLIRKVRLDSVVYADRLYNILCIFTGEGLIFTGTEIATVLGILNFCSLSPHSFYEHHMYLHNEWAELHWKDEEYVTFVMDGKWIYL